MSIKDTLIKNLSQAFDTPWPGPRGEIITLKSADLEVAVCPEDGARIISLKHKGVELLRQYHSERRAFQYGCFPMVPWPGRIAKGCISVNGTEHYLYQNKGENAMHGMAHFDPWQVKEKSDCRLVLFTTFADPYPFPCDAVQIIELQDNTLRLEVILGSTKQGLPVDAGWHPWFLKDPDNCGSEVKVSFEPDSMEEPGPNELPTGRKIAVPEHGPYDDCFNFNQQNASAVLSYANGRTINMHSNCPALVVFDKQPDAVCVNPMSGVPNGVNTAPHLIGPGIYQHTQSVWSFN